MESTEEKQIRITGTFNFPIDVLWDAWTSPDHVAKWWGPDGFTNTIHKMDLQKGGEWNLTMHGPDGTNYPNRSVFREIIPQKKIVFEHFNPHFFTTIVFRSEGNKTYIDWTMLFETAEMRETIIKANKADEGLKQNMERLEKYLSQLHA